MSAMFHIFFHDDVDGIVSAALILKYVVNGRPYTLKPAKTLQRGDKFDKIIEALNFDDVCVIVDYQYNKKADLWVDHHFNKELGDKPISNMMMRYDPKAKSAARIIFDLITMGPLGKFIPLDEYLADTVDMIDSANYESVEYIFNCTTPLMILRAHLEQMTISIDSLYSRIVEVISASDFDMSKAMNTLGLDDNIVGKLKHSAQSIEKAMVINGPVAITEMNRLYAYPRYAEYYVRPDMKYAFRVVQLGGGRIQTDIGFNQWCDFTNDIHIGKMLGSFDYTISGGGHHDVGGSIITIDKLEQHVDDILTILNPEKPVEEAEMEKVGVDVEVDSIEAKAVDMVKTGEVSDINEARKKVVKEKEGDKSNVQGSV